MLDENARPIAFGNTCEVFPWQDGKVIKLFYSGISSRHVVHECYMVKHAYEAGLTRLEPGIECQIGERLGLIYNQVEGKTMAVTLRKKPWLLWHYIKLFSFLHARLHRRQAPEAFPCFHQELRRQLEQSDHISSDTRGKLMLQLKGLKADTRVCHADFHLGNLLIDSHKQTTLIDWAGSMQGDADADVALCWLRMANVSATGEGLNWYERRILHAFAQGYIRYYLHYRPRETQNIVQWIPLMAFWLFNKRHHRHSTYLPRFLDVDQLAKNQTVARLFS